ncbi:MAG: ftsI [Rhizobacter sp.]|nr:ftsI [Rhizobacter sp.]
MMGNRNGNQRTQRTTGKARSSGANVRSVMYSTSPLLASKTPPWRSKFLVALVGAGFCVLLGRAAYVQVIGSDFYLKQGESRYARTLALTGNRGRIIDRNGQLLASSVPSPSLWAIPKDFEATPVQRKDLAKLMGMTPVELDRKLDDSPNFVWLRRQVDDDVADKVAALKIKGVHQVREYKRRYPEGETTSQIVGFTNIEDHGQEGIELAFQDELAGRDGSRRVIKDRLGRVVEDIGESVSAVNGKDVELSIDTKMQYVAYQRLRDAVIANKAKAGSAIVVDSQTGEVLALANYPSYVPGDRSNIDPALRRNRALTDTFEPGSAMKPFTVGLALETGRVTPFTMINTAPGRLTISGSTISDSHAHGMLTVQQVIQKSSNIGTVKMALQMQPREMWEVFTAIGLGQKPQVTFPGAVAGRLRPWKSWRPIEQATMAYGYGQSVSLFQLARAYTVWARHGDIIPVTLLKSPQTAVGTQVFSPKTAEEMRVMLQMAAGPGGTGPQAQTVGYSVGGKSGTAHKQEGKGYSPNKYRSWFVGIAPIKNPRIVMAVMLDEPSAGKYFGGDVAGPVFSDVVQQTLRMMNVAPDIDYKNGIVAHDVPAEEESF